MPAKQSRSLNLDKRQATKREERAQIAEELRDRLSDTEQIARNHQPLLALGPQLAHLRLDLAESLS
jgi:hypothetical protein